MTAEHFDVLIIGAGISGIGSAYHLKTQLPDTRFAVLDAHESFGGTWHLHTYPGARSDSDLFTFGYRFKYWPGPPIARRDDILRYLGEVIEENGIGPHIRYNSKVLTATWSSADNRWTLEVLRGDKTETVSASFLWMCQGYYNHAQGHTPSWKGIERFRGKIVHPQRWPSNLDYTGKRIIVIGSGATAATLIPSLAGKCGHVTMLQRSATYFVAGRNADALADQLRELGIDKDWIHEIMRKKYLYDHGISNRRAFSEPEAFRKELLQNVSSYLSPDYPLDPNFNPSYLPLRQRACYVPDGDLFKAIRSNNASVVTGEIDSFEEAGIRLASGELLKADIVVTATGFDLLPLGGIAFAVDGMRVDFAQTVGYRGMMFTGVPNMAWIFGYFRWSWTLRVDLVGDFVCRLLKHMKRRGAQKVEVTLAADEERMERLPWVSSENFNPGYMQRGMHLMPKQIDVPQWRHTNDYLLDREELPVIDLDEPAFRYS